MAKKQLHPGAKWLFRINGFFSVLFIMIFLSFFFGTFIAAIIAVSSGSGWAVLSMLFSVIVGLILAIAIAEIYSRMSYNRWFYEFTGEQLRIERGIIWKRYSNIPYQRIQNVDITRGIIARLCGFSSVNIQTAGYSMPVNARGFGAHSEGHIPAVTMQEAEHIREFLMKKITKRGSGL